MSLAQFSEAKRLVVQNSSTSVYDAARALENNHVGAVVVQDDGKVTGIVTDRDLALRVIGYDLDPKQIPLRDVMTPHPATLPSGATEQDAFELMRDRHVRRIPIVDGEKVTGIVTLDDLILAGAVGWVGAAAIVQAQLTEPAPAKPAGVPFPVRPAYASRTRSWRSDSEARHIARAERTLRAFTERLTQEVGLKDRGRALTAFVLVAGGIMQRVTPQEAQDFAAQLPSTIRERLLELTAGPDTTITRRTIEDAVAGALDLDRDTAAGLVRRIAESLRHFVSAGELEDVTSQLPADMKALFTPAT